MNLAPSEGLTASVQSERRLALKGQGPTQAPSSSTGSTAVVGPAWSFLLWGEIAVLVFEKNSSDDGQRNGCRLVDPGSGSAWSIEPIKGENDPPRTAGGRRAMNHRPIPDIRPCGPFEHGKGARLSPLEAFPAPHQT